MTHRQPILTIGQMPFAAGQIVRRARLREQRRRERRDAWQRFTARMNFAARLRAARG